MPKETGGWNGLRKNDANRNENGAVAGSERYCDFGAAAFGVLVAAAEGDAPFGEVLANGHFFLKTAAADASKDPGLDASAVAAWEHTLVFLRAGQRQAR